MCVCVSERERVCGRKSSVSDVRAEVSRETESKGQSNNERRGVGKGGEGGGGRNCIV